MENISILERIKMRISQDIGQATVQWEEIEKAGVFKSRECVKISDELFNFIKPHLSNVKEPEKSNKQLIRKNKALRKGVEKALNIVEDDYRGQDRFEIIKHLRSLCSNNPTDEDI